MMLTRRIIYVAAFHWPLIAAVWAQAPVRVTVDPELHGYAIPADFSGLSFERGTQNSGNAGASGYLFSPSNTQLVTLFQNLGIKNLRIGGGSVDTEIPVGTSSDGYASIDNLFQFAEAAGLKVIYSVRLLNPSANSIPNLVADDVAAAEYIWANYKNNLQSFAIGNEPDFHSYHTVDPLIYETVPGVPGSAYPSFLADWRDFANAILGSVPAAVFAGPETGAYSTLTYTPSAAAGVSWTQQFADDERSALNGNNAPLLTDATQHYYVGGSPGSTTSQQAIANMLSPDWVTDTAIGTQVAGTSGTTTFTPYPWLYANNLAPAVAQGVPFRLTESNDYLTGVPGASNAFASGLWTLDYMHWWAEHNAAGVNFHNKQWIYTDTIVPNPNPCVTVCGDYQTAPKGYGIKAFDLGGHGYVQPVTISNPNGVNLTAYAVGDAADVTVTIINKTQGPGGGTAVDATVRSKNSRAVSCSSMILSDGQPGNAGLMTATLGSAPISNDSRWAGQWTPLEPSSNGQCRLDVQASTAALVKIRSAGLYAGPIQINQDGALEIFSTRADGVIWYNSQKNATLPRSNPMNWTGWQALPGAAASAGGIAVMKNLDNTLEIFIPSLMGDVYHTRQLTPGGAWSGWSDLGGSGIRSLAAAANADGSLDVFGIGTNGDVWSNSQSAPGVGWSGWSDLSGANIEPGFVVEQNPTGDLELFGVDKRGDVWHNRQTNSGLWAGWNNSDLTGKELNPRLAVAKNLDGRVEVFGIDANGTVWHDWQTTLEGAWHGWSEIYGKRLRPGFVVGQNNDGKLVLFGIAVGEHDQDRDGDNRGRYRGEQDVWTIAQESAGGDFTGNWTDLGGSGIDRLSVGNTLDGRVQLFGTGYDNQVWSDWQETSGGQWNGWIDFDVRE